MNPVPNGSPWDGKRIIDLTVSLLIIVAGLPLIILILFLAFISTGQFPIIFQQRKISIGKKKINIAKIRTIKDCKDFNMIEKSCSEIFIKENYYKYVPLFCRWLRKTGLDEILQLINVLKGEMSLAGPRPLLESELAIMKAHQPEFYNRRVKINSKPGITGLWQVYGNRLKGASNLVELDGYYEKNKSLKLDVKIILKTIFILITADHSDAIDMGYNRSNGNEAVVNWKPTAEFYE